MAILVILWQMIVGTDKGSCEKCGRPGWRQTSIVDPCSPALKILCHDHHEENKKQWLKLNKCVICEDWRLTVTEDYPPSVNLELSRMKCLAYKCPKHIGIWPTPPQKTKSLIEKTILDQ